LYIAIVQNAEKAQGSAFATNGNVEEKDFKITSRKTKPYRI